HEGSATLRAAAAEALGSTRSREFVVNLGASTVNDPDPEVRAAAMRGLDAIGASDAAQYAERGINPDEDPRVIAAACSVIGTLQLYNDIPLLIGRLQDLDRDVRTEAKRALESFLEEGEMSREFDGAAWADWYRKLPRH